MLKKRKLHPFDLINAELKKQGKRVNLSINLINLISKI